MNNDAIAVANYFIDKALADTQAPHPFTLLRLVKYVYIAHGFAMAILDTVIINKNYDVVEAWKYGPVIPSVYHSFKYNKNNPITEKVSVVSDESDEGCLTFKEPSVEDDKIRMILDFVWDRYRSKSTAELITLLHQKDTPWYFCYNITKCKEIPDEMTKLYYQSIVNNASRP